MRLAHAFAVFAVAASLSAAAAVSSVPLTMSYQGYLTSGGVPVVMCKSEPARSESL